MLDKLTHLRALIRVLLFVTGTLFLVILQMIWALGTAMGTAIIFRKPRGKQSPIVRLWYMFCVWISGIKVTVANKRSLSKKQKIILSNHTSYLDILVLGAAFDSFFVAKIDIAGWPIFGVLAKIGGTLFISRQPRFIKQQLALLETHLNQGQSLLIFPEGTTNNGMKVETFKSSLLNAAFNAEKPPVIQPVSLVYTRMNGEYLETQEDYDKIAWYGDMLLAPHLWQVFRQRNIEAKITIHPAIRLTPDMDAKQVTALAQQKVVEGFKHAHPVLQP